MNARSQTNRQQLDEIEAIASSTSRVSDTLPYRFMGRVGRLDFVHLLEDQSFGIGFVVAVPSVESHPGAESYVANVIEQLIRRLPSDYVIQFYRRNSTDVEDYLELYAQQAGDDPTGQRICEAVLKRWRDASEKGFFPRNSDLNFFPCREEMAIMVKSPPSNGWNFSPEHAWQLLFDPEAASPRFTKFARAFELVVREIRETALSGSLGLSPMGADGFIPFVVTMLAPNGRSRETIARGSAIDSVADAISSSVAIDLTNDEGEVRLDGFTAIRDGQKSVHRVVSMLWQPGAVAPGMCNDLVYRHRNVTVVTTIKMLPQLLESAKLKVSAWIQSKSKTVFNAQEAEERTASLNSVATRLYSGEKIVSCRMQAIVTAATDTEADDAVLRMKSSMEAMFPSEDEKVFGTSLMLPGSLPFCHSDERERTTRRMRRMMSKDIAEMIPAGGRWGGIVPTSSYLAVETNRRKPITMYANSVGGPLFINSHQCETNPHILVVGGSGSGKTFFIQDLLLQMWRTPDLRAYLISIKPDYKRLSMLLGKYIEIDLDDENISINPLGGRPTLNNQSIWTQAVCLMVSDGNAGEAPSRDERVLISEAVMLAAQKNWDAQNDCQIRETILEHVVAELIGLHKEMGESLAHRLKPYYRGAYRNLINRPRTISRDNRFVFFNLAGVSKSPCCAVVMFSLFTFIDGLMYDPSLVGVPKVVAFDEGWASMGDVSSAALMEKSARAYRSHGGQAIFISQSFSDYDNSLGRAILANTATKIILPQEQSELNKLPNFIDLNELEIRAVRNLKLHKRHYSEFFVKMQGHASTTGRVIPDPFKYAIATTDPADEDLHMRLLDETGGDYVAATNLFAQQYPYGNAAVTAN